MARLGAIGGIERPLVNRQHRLGEARAATAGTLVGAAMSSSVRNGPRSGEVTFGGRIKRDWGWYTA
jgi:hypothetical protein